MVNWSKSRWPRSRSDAARVVRPQEWHGIYWTSDTSRLRLLRRRQVGRVDKSSPAAYTPANAASNHQCDGTASRTQHTRAWTTRRESDCGSGESCRWGWQTAAHTPGISTLSGSSCAPQTGFFRRPIEVPEIMLLGIKFWVNISFNYN